jgi:ketosteroid isomerase-like protein
MMSNGLKAQAASQESMKHVMAKNKQGWLSLFSHDAIVEDPVGISPLDPTGLGQHGIEAITAFWDNIIAPGDITLTINASIPAGDECANLVNIVKVMGELRIENDMIVVYAANDQGLITSLKAYWEYAVVEAQITAQLSAG